MSINHDEENLPDYETGGDVAKGALVAVLVVAALIALVFGVYVLATGDGDDDETPAAQDTTSEQTEQEPPAEDAVDEDNPCPIPDVTPVASPPSFDEAPDPATAGEGTRNATIATSCGDITVELYADKAPQAVASFAFLAGEDFFSNTLCHRLVVQGIYVLQCGDPTATGTGGPGYTFGPVEHTPADEIYPEGTLAMARTADPNSNGSQFFIVYKDSPIPNTGGAGYTVFGKVTDGLDVVNKVAEGGLAPGGEAPRRPIALTKVTVD